MDTSNISNLTIAQAGPVLEAEFRRRFGDQEYEKLYRSLDLQMSELTSDQETQIYRVIAMIGRAGNDKTIIFLSIVWLAKKKVSDLLAKQMLEAIHQKLVKQLFLEARRSMQSKQ